MGTAGAEKAETGVTVMENCPSLGEADGDDAEGDHLWKNGSHGCTEQAACQWGQGSGSILPSFGGGFGLDLWHCSACSLCPRPLPVLSWIRNLG